MSKRKAPSVLEYPNQDICEFLMELAEYELCRSNMYQYTIHRNAAEILGGLPGRIKNAHEAKKLPGIGKKIIDKIEEFLETGTYSQLELIKKSKKRDAINMLMKVRGIGPAKAEKLVDTGIKTVADLKKHEGKLTASQRLELKYFEDFEKKIPKREVANIEKLLTEAVTELNHKYLVTICGNYRRGLDETSIVAVVTHPDYRPKGKTKNKEISMKMIVECLKDRDLIADTITLGPTIFMGACRLPTRKKGRFRRLTIHLVSYDQYYCATLHYTGSETFNKIIKAYALEQKYLLSKDALKSTAKGAHGKAEKITCEEDIFDILGLSYELPEWRNP